MNIKAKDITNEKFGRLTALYRDDYVQPNGRKRTSWKCKCECGNEITVMYDNLKSGATMSCGCLAREMISKRASTHHMTDTHIYGVWCSMKTRCYTKSATGYPFYGARGITVCDEWRNSFETFYEWAIENGYKEGLTIERKDYDGNYCPENCCWITSVAQANNRKSNRRYSLNGETHNVTEWSKIYGIDPRTVFDRIYSGWDFERAITTKVKTA